MSKTSFPYTTMPFSLKIIDNHLPGKIAYQVKVLLFGFATIVFYSVLDKQPIFSEQFLNFLILVMILMETFLWLSFKIFIKGVNLGETQKEITKNIIRRYAVYYLLCLLASFIEFILFIYVLNFIHGWDVSKVLYNFLHNDFKTWFKAVNIGLLFGTFLFVIMIWQEALKEAQKFKEEKLQFQYETLKNQVNPHFLFNSLNTLSSLVSSNTELAERFIQKLSSIYRYVLEYRETELVDLPLEIAFVKDYFYLQQIRDEDKISLTIDIPEPTNQKILPLSLQLLVENALKHNSYTNESPLKILIRQNENTLVITNNLQKKLTLDHSPKIGLKNLGERTKFIAKKELQIIQTSDEFKIILPLIPA